MSRFYGSLCIAANQCTVRRDTVGLHNTSDDTENLGTRSKVLQFRVSISTSINASDV